MIDRYKSYPEIYDNLYDKGIEQHPEGELVLYKDHLIELAKTNILAEKAMIELMYSKKGMISDNRITEAEFIKLLSRDGLDEELHDRLVYLAESKGWIK